MGAYAPGVSEGIPSGPVHKLLLSCQLWTYLADLNEQAQERMEKVIQQMKDAENISETLKAADPMAWVQRMNSIRNRAVEIILQELIYGEEAA